MVVDLKEELSKLHVIDPKEALGLIEMCVHTRNSRVWVGQVHQDCLPAFQSFVEEGIFKRADHDLVEFSPLLESFEARTQALRQVVDAIDQNPDIFGPPTQYSLDDYRPIPSVSEPLLAIPRPYCRKGFSVPTDCSYMVIRRPNGDVLFTVRAENIGIEGDPTGADNYSGKFDIVGGAHVFDPETAHGDTDEVLFDSLIQRAHQKVGITTEDINDIHYLGSTTFHHTRGNRVFHFERHSAFLVEVPDHWTPQQSGNDVAQSFWASPEEAVQILQGEPVKGFDSVVFNTNALQASVNAFMQPELGIITPERVGQDMYSSLELYLEQHQIPDHEDPAFIDINARIQNESKTNDYGSSEPS